MTSKVDHVRKAIAAPSHGHSCHWPGCEEEVAPAAWGCRKHWFMLPKGLRSRIWAAYRPGQEQSKTPSREYIEAARDVQDWIARCS